MRHYLADNTRYGALIGVLVRRCFDIFVCMRRKVIFFGEMHFLVVGIVSGILPALFSHVLNMFRRVRGVFLSRVSVHFLFW